MVFERTQRMGLSHQIHTNQKSHPVFSYINLFLGYRQLRGKRALGHQEWFPRSFLGKAGEVSLAQNR